MYCSQQCQRGDWNRHRELCHQERLNIDGMLNTIFVLWLLKLISQMKAAYPVHDTITTADYDYIVWKARSGLEALEYMPCHFIVDTNAEPLEVDHQIRDKTALIDFTRTPPFCSPISIEDLQNLKWDTISIEYDEANQVPVGVILPKSGGGTNVDGIWFAMDKHGIPGVGEPQKV